MTCKRVLVLDYDKIEKVSILVVDSHINAGWQLQRKTAVWNPVFRGCDCTTQVEKKKTRRAAIHDFYKVNHVWVLFIDDQKRIFLLCLHPYEVTMSRSYKLDDSDLESRWGRDFPHTDPLAHPASCKMGTGSLSQIIKLPGMC